MDGREETIDATADAPAPPEAPAPQDTPAPDSLYAALEQIVAAQQKALDEVILQLVRNRTIRIKT